MSAGSIRDNGDDRRNLGLRELDFKLAEQPNVSMGRV